MFLSYCRQELPSGPLQWYCREDRVSEVKHARIFSEDTWKETKMEKADPECFHCPICWNPTGAVESRLKKGESRRAGLGACSAIRDYQVGYRSNGRDQTIFPRLPNHDEKASVAQRLVPSKDSIVVSAVRLSSYECHYRCLARGDDEISFESAL